MSLSSVAREGLRDYKYCVTYEDLKGSELSVLEIKDKHVRELRECLAYYIRDQGLSVREKDVFYRVSICW